MSIPILSVCSLEHGTTTNPRYRASNHGVIDNNVEISGLESADPLAETQTIRDSCYYDDRPLSASTIN